MHTCLSTELIMKTGNNKRRRRHRFSLSQHVQQYTIHVVTINYAYNNNIL